MDSTRIQIVAATRSIVVSLKAAVDALDDGTVDAIATDHAHARHADSFVAAEALTNVSKYAHAEHATVHVRGGLQAELAEQMCALVRELIQLAIGDRLAGRRHLIGDLVRLGARVDGRMCHGCFLNKKMASRKHTPCSPVAKRFSCC